MWSLITALAYRWLQFYKVHVILKKKALMVCVIVTCKVCLQSHVTLLMERTIQNFLMVSVSDKTSQPLNTLAWNVWRNDTREISLYLQFMNKYWQHSNRYFNPQARFWYLHYSPLWDGWGKKQKDQNCWHKWSLAKLCMQIPVVCSSALEDGIINICKLLNSQGSKQSD